MQGTAFTAKTKLTVGGQTVSFVFGTGNQIRENANKTQFLEDFAVQVQDASGHPVDNVQVTLAVHSATPAPLYAYAKGAWVLPMNASSWQQAISALCTNEDQNLNFVLDPGEDTNLDGTLEPGDVASVSPGTVTTALDSVSGIDGSAAFTIVYPEDHALWVKVKVTATATVKGTEATGSIYFWLPMLASYISSTTSSPPGLVSPYGFAIVCTNPNSRRVEMN